VLLMAVSGVVAVTTGRLLPTLRGRVVRPELWGYGAADFGVGMATGMSLRWWADSLAMDDAGAATALALIALGGALQWRAQRPAPRDHHPQDPHPRPTWPRFARAALGHTLNDVTRIRGGSKKGVYRLTFEDRSTAVAYVWSPDEDLWDAGPGDPRDPFSHASGLTLFTAAANRLAAAGVRAPRLLHADPTHTHLPADVAIVEDLPGGTLEDLLNGDPAAVPSQTSGSYLRSTTRSFIGMIALSVILMCSGQTSVQHLVMLQ
jgi:hypothetical protein